MLGAHAVQERMRAHCLNVLQGAGRYEEVMPGCLVHMPYRSVCEPTVSMSCREQGGGGG